MMKEYLKRHNTKKKGILSQEFQMLGLNSETGRRKKKRNNGLLWIGRRKKYQFYLFAVQIHNSPLLNQWRQRGTEESFIFQSCQTNIRGYFLRVAASWIEQVSIEIYQLFKLLV